MLERLRPSQSSARCTPSASVASMSARRSLVSGGPLIGAVVAVNMSRPSAHRWLSEATASSSTST